MAAIIEVVGDNTPAKTVVATEVRRAIELFLTAGVRPVEAACNRKRESLMARLKQMPAEGLLDDYGLPGVTVTQAVGELAPPFQLTEPQRVIIDMRYEVYRPNPKTAMAADKTRGIMLIFVNAIDHVNLRDLYGHMPVSEITFHEMLHLCGETQHDGVVRYNWAGVDAIKELLEL